MLNRSLPPASNPVVRFNFAKVQTQYMSNGIPIHVISSGNHDILRLEIIFRSGKWYEKINGSSFFCSKLMLEGTEKMDALEIAENFERVGAFLHVYPGTDYINFTLHTINRYLEKLLPIIKELITIPSFPVDELEILKNLKIQKLKVELEKNSYLATREFRKLVFGAKHPYGMDIDIEEIQSRINKEILVDFYENIMITAPEVILSGKVEQRHIDLISLVLGDLKFRQPANDRHINEFSFGENCRVEKDASVQVSIRYGNKIINKVHKDYVDLLILNEILGGYFGSRLMKNVRENKGYTYGINSSIISMVNDAFLVIGSDVKKEYYEQVIDAINKEIHKLRIEKIGEEELTTVKNYMNGMFLSSLETSFALADKFKSVYLYGLDYTYYDRYLDRIRDISPERIQEIANKYLLPDSFNLVMVG